jgi:hypothetical protein
MNVLYCLLKRYPQGVNGQGWDVWRLCENPQFPFQYLREHPEGIYCMVDGELKIVDWDFDLLSYHSRLEFDLVNQFPDKNWNWNYSPRMIDWIGI